MENYVVVELSAGSIIETAVDMLQELQNKGVPAKCEFNGKTLYSDTVTLESAYHVITGKSYKECMDAQKQWRENYDREQQEWKNNLPVKIAEWIEKGKKILDSDMLDEWVKIVPARAGGIYHGMELDACLEIVKILNGGKPVEDAAKMIELQGHSGMSYSLVRAMVNKFSKRGAEFIEATK